MSKIRKAVFDAVNKERNRQDILWGGPTHDDWHSEKDWCVFIITYLGRAIDWANEEKDFLEKYEHNMLKVAALAISALEQIKRAEQERNRP